jgi:hypothetical protein
LFLSLPRKGKVYATRTRFIPDELLGPFERTVTGIVSRVEKIGPMMP